jgi:hypothetical protein
MDMGGQAAAEGWGARASVQRLRQRLLVRHLPDVGHHVGVGAAGLLGYQRHLASAQALVRPVSYTHMTLPTICSV